MGYAASTAPMMVAVDVSLEIRPQLARAPPRSAESAPRASRSAQDGHAWADPPGFEAGLLRV